MAEKRPIRFGIFGAARIAPDALIKAAHKVPEAEVVAVAARDPKRAQEFAATNKIPRVIATYEDLVNDPELDAIYNPLPNSLHCEWTIAALRAGKHVLCEKPLASNAAEAERMSKAADETGKILGEAFHYRYHPLADRVRALISDGTLGRLVHVEGQFSVPIPRNEHPLRLQPCRRRDDGPRVLPAPHDSLFFRPDAARDQRQGGDRAEEHRHRDGRRS